MSEQSPYEQLGVSEGASFDEIQEARSRMIEACGDDRKQIEALETAYDAILMERLRMRQEGKIKVPDRIRYAERLAEPPPATAPTPPKQASNWLQQFIDTPSRNDILLPGGLFLVASLLSLAVPEVALAFGVGFSLYFLNRKENKFGRSLLLTLLGLVLGVLVGLQLAMLLQTQLTALSFDPNSFAALITFVLLWLISSFLR